MHNCWRKMTVEEYAEAHKSFGLHYAVSRETVQGVQEAWVHLGSAGLEKVDDALGCRDALAEENARLRAALEEIKEFHEEIDFNASQSPVWNIADKALKSPHGE